MSKDQAVSSKLKRKDYEKELRKLQVQLCHLQEWVKEKKLRIIIPFEGRDAAGKGGIILIKLWLKVGMDEQETRFQARIEDPLRQWKLSPMDTESFGRWYDYSRARDLMFNATDTKHAPWRLIRSDDKRRARLNVISHILRTIPYKKIARDKVELPKRSHRGRYNDQASLRGKKFVEERY